MLLVSLPRSRATALQSSACFSTSHSPSRKGRVRSLSSPDFLDERHQAFPDLPMHEARERSRELLSAMMVIETEQAVCLCPGGRAAVCGRHQISKLEQKGGPLRAAPVRRSGQGAP